MREIEMRESASLCDYVFSPKVWKRHDPSQRLPTYVFYLSFTTFQTYRWGKSQKRLVFYWPCHFKLNGPRHFFSKKFFFLKKSFFFKKSFFSSKSFSLNAGSLPPLFMASQIKSQVKHAYCIVYSFTKCIILKEREKTWSQNKM